MLFSGKGFYDETIHLFRSGGNFGMDDFFIRPGGSKGRFFM